MVFHRYLQDLNRTRFQSAPPFSVQPSPTIHREADRYEPASEADAPAAPGPGLLPKLGELLPITPDPQTRIVVETPRPIYRQTGSGRMIDLLA